MRPFDPRLLTEVPATRRPVLTLGAIGVVLGLVTIGLAFALTSLVVAVVEGHEVVTPALWLVVLFTLRALLAATSEQVGTWAGMRVSTVLRESLIGTWLERDADSRPETGRAQTLAAQGMTSIEPYVARYLPALVSAAFLPFLAIATLAFVDWPSALIVTLTVPLLPVFAALIGHTTQESTQRRWRSLSALSGHFLDVMRGLPTLASYGRAEAQVETIEAVSLRHRLATMRTLRLAFMSSAALELLASLSVALVAVTVGIRLANGSMPLYTGMLAILLAPEAYWPIRRVGAEFHSAADGAEALSDVLSELAPTTPRPNTPSHRVRQSRPPSRCRSQGPGTGLGRPSGVGRGWWSRAWVTATRARPRTSCATCPSTWRRAECRDRARPARASPRCWSSWQDSGRRAQALSSAPASHLVSQRPFLAPGTVRDNLTLGNDSTDDALWEVLREVGLESTVAALTQGLETRLGDDGFGLSAGQRARLTLARAALSTSPLILLDEPTAHLDVESAALAHNLIRRLAGQRIVVAVSHRPELLALADKNVEVTLAPEAYLNEVRS